MVAPVEYPSIVKPLAATIVGAVTLQLASLFHNVHVLVTVCVVTAVPLEFVCDVFPFLSNVMVICLLNIAYKIVSADIVVDERPVCASLSVFHPTNVYPAFVATFPDRFTTVPSGKYSFSAFVLVPPFSL